MVQLSYLHMTTGKTIALTIWKFVGKVMSLLFNILSICLSFHSKEQASFNFMAAVTMKVKKVKVKSLSHVRLFATPWTIAHQSPPSMGFSRQDTGVESIPFSRGPSWPRDQTQVSHIAGRFFTIWAIRVVKEGSLFHFDWRKVFACQFFCDSFFTLLRRLCGLVNKSRFSLFLVLKVLPSLTLTWLPGLPGIWVLLALSCPRCSGQQNLWYAQQDVCFSSMHLCTNSCYACNHFWLGKNHAHFSQ